MEIQRKITNPSIKIGPWHYLDPTAHDHQAAIEAAIKDGAPIGERVEGFFDSWGNFLTREEAYPVARAAFQLLRKNTDCKLYSDNIAVW